VIQKLCAPASLVFGVHTVQCTEIPMSFCQ